ncbi:MAG: hypothetical protein KGM60_07770 [Comamonadaceae bacterium]|nr:hypothetical protein [Comamonadaceae bacterium]
MTTPGDAPPSLVSHTTYRVQGLTRESAHAHGAAFIIATHDARLTGRCARVLNLPDGRLQ